MKDKLDPVIKKIKEVQEQRQEEERNKEFSKICPFFRSSTPDSLLRK